jgi:hypothetical protein
MAAAAYAKIRDVSTSPYGDLADDARVESLMKLLVHAHCLVYGVSPRSPLEIAYVLQ